MILINFNRFSSRSCYSIPILSKTSGKRYGLVNDMKYFSSLRKWYFYENTLLQNTKRRISFSFFLCALKKKKKIKRRK